MDPLDAILASMAKATGNAPSTAAASTATVSSKKKSAPVKTKKRQHEDSDDDEDDGDTLTFPTAASDDTAIWNAGVMQKLSEAVLQKRQKAAKQYSLTPLMEISRQQTVRTLCSKIKRASEDMGIDKLPNSTYETWQFTSKLTVAEVLFTCPSCYLFTLHSDANRRPWCACT